MIGQYAVAASFYKAMARLAPGQIADVLGAVEKLDRGLASVHLHALEGASLKSFGVNRDALRIICMQEGDTLLLLHVDSHDEAYEWARRHRVQRVGRIVRVLRVQEEVEQAPVELDAALPPGPLAAIPNKWFRRIGVEARAAAQLRAIPDEDTLLEVAACCQTALGQALVDYATEPDRWDRIVAEYERALEVGAQVPSLAEAIKDPANAAVLWLPPGEDALAAALQGNVEQWQIFLHPSQRRLVTKRGSGALKVTGGPGTGKTVVALHRARFLAEEVFPGERVLLTAFSRSLARQLEASVRALCAGEPALLERVEVRTLTAVAQEVLRRAGEPAALVAGEALQACWREAMGEEALGRPQHFYASEREQVLERQGVWAEPLYLQAERTGRRDPLSRAQKRAVWRVLAAFDAALQARAGGDDAALARQAALAVRSSKVAAPWAAVVCDEVQDAGASQLRLLAGLTADREQGRIRPDALFLCGDGYQRLYRTPVALARCGIPIAGRSWSLRLNYRTTEGIRRAAVAIARGLEQDVLDEVSDGSLTSFDGYRSLRGGPPPEERTFGTAEAEADWIAGELGNDGELTLVLARTQDWLQQLATLLRRRGVDAPLLGRDDELPSRVPAVLCTLHRAKGLEAPRVIIAGRQLLPLRWNGHGDANDKALWERREQCLLYVGLTRARDWCGVSRVASESRAK